eukprot:1150969-Pelagomonas_calceolata.AAC.3
MSHSSNMMKIRGPQITLLASDHPKGPTAPHWDSLLPPNYNFLAAIYFASILQNQKGGWVWSKFDLSGTLHDGFCRREMADSCISPTTWCKTAHHLGTSGDAGRQCDRACDAHSSCSFLPIGCMHNPVMCLATLTTCKLGIAEVTALKD